MVVVLEKNISDKQIEDVIKHLEDFGFDVHKSTGVEQIVLGAIGVKPDFDTRKVKILDGVAEVYRITDPFKLASRTFQNYDTTITIKDVTIGGDQVVVMAGPCSVESEKTNFYACRSRSKKRRKNFKRRRFQTPLVPILVSGLGRRRIKINA